MASVGSDEWRAVCDKFTNAQHLSDVESRSDPENNPFLSKYKAREVLREIHCALKSFEAGDGDGEEEVCGESPESGVQRSSEPPVERPSEDVFVLGFSGDSPAGLRAARLGAVEYYLGVNHVDTEELSAGQEHLMNCMKLLGRCKVSPENVSLFIHVRVPSSSSTFSISAAKQKPQTEESNFLCVTLMCWRNDVIVTNYARRACLYFQNQLGILWAGRDETETAQGFLETAEFIYQRYMKEVGSWLTD